MDNNKHKMYLVQILTDVYSDRELSVALGFKGGTAAMLFYGLPRFSVDLDFNLLDKNAAEAVYQKVKKIVLKYGKRYLKIDISHRVENDEYVIKNLLGINVKIMEVSDMFSHKLVALLGRKEFAERDIFDCWYFMKEKTPVNRQIVESLTQKPLSEYLQDCIDKMENLSKRSLLYGLGELVADDMKSFVRSKLQQETVFLLKSYQMFPLLKKS
jgi:predicted nucleotidyltransferase component of viral defense system